MARGAPACCTLAVRRPVAVALAGRADLFRAGVDLVTFGVTVTDRKGDARHGPDPGRLRDRRGRAAADGAAVRTALGADETAGRLADLHPGCCSTPAAAWSATSGWRAAAAIRFLNRCPTPRTSRWWTSTPRCASPATASGTSRGWSSGSGAGSPTASPRSTMRSASTWTAPTPRTAGKVLVLYTDGGDSRRASVVRRAVDLLKASHVDRLRGRLPRQPGRRRADADADAAAADRREPRAAWRSSRASSRTSTTLTRSPAPRFAPVPAGLRVDQRPSDGRWRKVEVKVTRPGVKVRARQGLFRALQAVASCHGR